MNGPDLLFSPSDQDAHVLLLELLQWETDRPGIQLFVYDVPLIVVETRAEITRSLPAEQFAILLVDIVAQVEEDGGALSGKRTPPPQADHVIVLDNIPQIGSSSFPDGFLDFMRFDWCFTISL